MVKKRIHFLSDANGEMKYAELEKLGVYYNHPIVEQFSALWDQWLHNRLALVSWGDELRVALVGTVTVAIKMKAAVEKVKTLCRDEAVEEICTRGNRVYIIFKTGVNHLPVNDDDVYRILCFGDPDAEDGFDDLDHELYVDEDGEEAEW